MHTTANVSETSPIPTVTVTQAHKLLYDFITEHPTNLPASETGTFNGPYIAFNGPFQLIHSLPNALRNIEYDLLETTQYADNSISLTLRAYGHYLLFTVAPTFDSLTFAYMLCATAKT